MRIFQLSLLIRRELEDARKALALEKQIQDANAQAPEKGAIGRRVLKKLAFDPEHVTLSYSQLVALDNYFNFTRQPGLDQQPIFLKTGVVDCLVEKPRLAFLLGSIPRRHEQRNDISRWDTRSVAHLLHEVCLRSAALTRRREGVSFEIEDVLLEFPPRLDKFPREDWYTLLEDRHTSVLAIGSPRASHASEILLARFFHQKPFQSPITGDVSLPFYFIWPDPDRRETRGNFIRSRTRLKGSPPGFRSRFALSAEDIKQRDKALARAISQGKACAFCFNETIYPVQIGPKTFKMYAVIAAQRRSGGQTHVVIAGISGPATHAAATLLSQIKEPLPVVANQDAPVFYVPIEVDIRLGALPNRRGDIREVVSCKFLDDAKTWSR